MKNKKVLNLKSDFKYFNQKNGVINVKTSTFPGGEEFVRIEHPESVENTQTVSIATRLNNSNDIMQLVMVTNALRNLNVCNIELFIPYVPYARQDRVCTPGESHSIKAFANILNSLNFSKVTVYDPHSDVVGAVINNIKIMDNINLVKTALNTEYNTLQDNTVLISPDAGALKKIYNVAKETGFTDIAIGEKIRNLKTTEIIKTEINREDFSNKDCWIIDDICDGGRTFIELSKVLKERNASNVFLVVSHGIFCKGFNELKK